MATIPSLDTVYSWIPEENQKKLAQPIEFRSLIQIADGLLDWDGDVAMELGLEKMDIHDINKSGENRGNPRQQR